MAEEVPRYFKKPSGPKGLFVAFRCLEVEAITQKVRGLILFPSFEQKAGELFFPVGIGVVKEGDQPKRGRRQQKTDDQGRYHAIHLFSPPSP